ncbi:MAG: hypothetical protein FJ291_32935 [Planctomycetes bacterium]|nr:hypothetical protein [Planctomycetota bacterium]
MSPERFSRLHGECRRIINGIRKARRFTAEDIADMDQEMAGALLGLDDGQTDSYCLERAAWAALAWLRKTYGRSILFGIQQSADLVPLIDSGKWRRVWC